MWFRKFLKMRPDGDGGDGGGGSAATPAASAPAAAPAPAASAPTASAPAAPAATSTPATPAAADPGDSNKTTEGYWPADWRETASKGDAKLLTRLGRYASPQAVTDALIAAQNRISAGELKPVLGKNASADEIKAWRADHGIPETPDKYDLGKDVKVEGMAPELLGEVFKAAHESNQTPDQVKATLKAWNAISNSVAASRAEADIKVQKDGEDALRAEWGAEFRRNINLIHGMLDGSASPGLKESIMGGRLADGTPIGSSPEALKFLVGLALIQNPTGVVVPGSEANPMQGIEDELTKINTFMNKDRAAYNKDEKMQARMRELLVAKEKMKPRQAA